ncbi:MAG: glycosyltransferase family 39 protein [Patescibacteria group bacterium]
MNKIIKRITRVKYIEYILLSILIIIGLLVRLYKINNPIADWHSWRQADTASVTKMYLKDGINLLFPKYQDISSIQTGKQNPEGYRFVEFPIYNAIHAVLFKNIGIFSLEIWGRLVSILSSLVSAVLIFALGKRYLNKWGGLLASFFFLFIPYNIYFSRVILPEPMGTMFALFAVYFFIKYVDYEKILNLILSGIFFSLAVLIKPFYLFYSVPLLYLLIDKYTFKKLFKDLKTITPFIFYSLIILIPLIAWRIWISKYPEGIPFYKWAFNGNRIRFKPAYWYWIYSERLGRLILGVWGLVPFIFGVFASKNKKHFNIFFMLGVLLYALVVATASVMHDYYQISMVPAISLLVAQGSLFLWNNEFFNRKLSRSLLIFSILIMLISGWYQSKEYYNVNHPEIIEAGKAIDKIAPKDALILVPYNGDTAFLYQTGRSGWPAVDSSIKEIKERGADYYLSVNFNDKDTIQAMNEYKVIERTSTYVIVDLNQPNLP